MASGAPGDPVRARRRRRVLASCAAATLLALAALALGGWRPLLATAPRLLVERQEPREADALVVLAGDHTGRRVEAAVALFRFVRRGPFVISGGQLYADVTWAAVMRDHALALGVPADRIVLQDRSRTTVEDARFTLPFLAERGARTVLLVTSPWHTSRAARLFRREAGARLEVVVCPSANEAPDAWWTDAKATRGLAAELLARLWPDPS